MRHLHVISSRTPGIAAAVWPKVAQASGLGLVVLLGLMACNLTDGGEETGSGNAGGSGGSGGGGECLPPADAPFHVGMCFTAPDYIAPSWPLGAFADGLVVAGDVPDSEPSCFDEERSGYRNPFEDLSSFTMDKQRFELRDSGDRRWTLEIALPKLRRPVLRAGDTVTLRWAIDAVETDGEMFGYVVVELADELVAGAGNGALPPGIAVEPLEPECVELEACDGGGSAFHTRVRVQVDLDAKEMSLYTIAEVGNLVVANEDYESGESDQGGECSEFGAYGPTIGVYPKALAE